jgi:hypothetical protein
VIRTGRKGAAGRIDQDWPEGGCWQDIVDSMVEGSRENVVCPFAGTSEGSGFFVKEQDGRSRFVSNAQSITYINTYRPNTTGITPMVASASGGSGGSAAGREESQSACRVDAPSGQRGE